jgi:hypothetical protein
MGSLITNAPYWFVGLLGLLGIAVLFTGLRRGNQQMRLIGFIALFVAILLVVLRLVLPTDEKRAEKQARDLIAAVSEQNWDRMKQMTRHASLVAPGISIEGDGIADTCQRVAKDFGLVSVKVNSIDMKKEPNVITAVVSVTSSHSGAYVDTVPSTWVFEYQKRGDAWVLTRIESQKIGAMGQTVDVREVLRGR